MKRPELPSRRVVNALGKSEIAVTPTGLQIVGRTYDDVSVLQAAKAYETANPWTGKRPSL